MRRDAARSRPALVWFLPEVHLWVLSSGTFRKSHRASCDNVRAQSART